MNAGTNIAHDLSGRLSALGARLPGADLGWLADLRQRAVAELEKAGLPTVRSEGWRHTNPAPLWPALLDGDGSTQAELPATDDLPAGVSIRTLSEVLESDDGRLAGVLNDALDGALERLVEFPLGVLNLAFMDGGYVVTVDDGVVVEQPLEISLPTTSATAPVCLRNVIIAGANSRVEVIENYLGDGGIEYAGNHATQVVCGQGALVRRTKLQAEGDGASHLASTHATVAKDGRFENFELSLGGKLSRSEAILRLAGEGATLSYNGAYLMRGKQHCDHSTWIDHCASHTESRETFKGVLDDAARAVFQGRITVRPGTKQVDGHQLNKTLLLSNDAEIDSKPELEIYADDVKCAHGATAGRLDEDQLFYLRARGIPEEEARAMLIEAFLGEALELIERDELREALSARVGAWFGTSMQEGPA